MNMQSLTIVLGVITAFALGACTVETKSSTSTGAGGSTSASGTTNSVTGTSGAATGGGGAGGGSSASTSVSASATGTGGEAPCDNTVHCAEAIPDGIGYKLCDETESAKLYDAFFACACTVDGACGSVCSNNYCSGAAVTTPTCTACLQNSTAKGCKKEFDACSGDV